jgi:transposase
MTTMTSTHRLVTGGVDTHRDFHVAAALDHLGGVLGTARFPTTLAGYRSLLAWLSEFGQIVVVGVEGTGSYGAALARHLAIQEVRVIEVGRPNRQVRRRHGKTDVVDAIAAARAVQSGDATATPKSHDGPVEALRALKMVQRSGRKARTQALNQLHALVLTAPEDLRGKLRDLKTRALITTCAGFRVRSDDDTLSAIMRLSMRELARRIAVLEEQNRTLTTRMRRITTELAPELVAKPGVGPDTATTLLITAGDNPERLGHEKSFAALVGASPIPVNSGQTQDRVRLNRGGDRDANSALWRITIVRMAIDQDTRDYVAKRQSEGKTKSEAIRCSQALHRPRGIQRPTLSSHRLTVGASLTERIRHGLGVLAARTPPADRAHRPRNE